MNLLSVRDAAERLGLSVATIYGLCAARKIRHERHGLGRGRIKIPEDALEEYRRQQTVPPAENSRRAAPLEVPLPRPRLRLRHLN